MALVSWSCLRELDTYFYFTFPWLLRTLWPQNVVRSFGWLKKSYVSREIAKEGYGMGLV